MHFSIKILFVQEDLTCGREKETCKFIAAPVSGWISIYTKSLNSF